MGCVLSVQTKGQGVALFWTRIQFRAKDGTTISLDRVIDVWQSLLSLFYRKYLRKCHSGDKTEWVSTNLSVGPGLRFPRQTWWVRGDSSPKPSHRFVHKRTKRFTLDLHICTYYCEHGGTKWRRYSGENSYSTPTLPCQLFKQWECGVAMRVSRCNADENLTWSNSAVRR